MTIIGSECEYDESAITGRSDESLNMTTNAGDVKHKKRRRAIRTEERWQKNEGTTTRHISRALAVAMGTPILDENGGERTWTETQRNDL